MCYSPPSSKERNFTHALVSQVQSQTLPHWELLHCFWLPDAKRGTSVQKVRSTHLTRSKTCVKVIVGRFGKCAYLRSFRELHEKIDAGLISHITVQDSYIPPAALAIARMLDSLDWIKWIIKLCFCLQVRWSSRPETSFIPQQQSQEETPVYVIRQRRW